MKMKNIISKIIFVLIIDIGLILGGKVYSEAIEISFADLAGSSHLYCIAHGAPLNDGPKSYSVGAYRKIVGKTAYDGSETEISTSNLNAAFAYVLCGGSYSFGYGGPNAGDYSTRQLSVYNLFNSWVSNVGLGSWAWSSNSSSSTSLTAEAWNYAYSLDDPVKLTNQRSDKPDTVVTSNKDAGPFTFDFSGTVTSVNIYDTSGSEISMGEHLYLYKKEGETKTKIDNVNEIESGKSFYISNTSGKRLGSIKITVSKTIFVAGISLLHAGENQKLMSVTRSSTTEEKEKKIKIITVGDIKIEKKDRDTDAKLKGAGFKLYNVDEHKWISGGSTEHYTYNSDYNHAKEFGYTNAHGKLKIKGLDLGTYRVFETTAPKEYKLEYQDGYESDKRRIKIGEVTIDEDTSIPHGLDYPTVKENPENEKVITIEGYVWEDKADYKNSHDTDNKFVDGESKIPGVKVRLFYKGSGGTAIKLAEKTTDANGHYKFGGSERYIRNGHKYKIKEVNVKNYYIEFNYSETAYRRYIPVAFNSTNVGDIIQNGSRAIMQKVKRADKDLSGIATTYKGHDNTKEKKYGLSSTGNLYEKLYVKNECRLDNINLGIKPLPETDFKVEENIAEVIINMRGYTYTYTYGGRGDTSLRTAPTISFQSKNNIRAFTRAVYPSDISYDIQHNGETPDSRLRIYVVYRIDITNTTTLNLEFLYQESRLHITNVKNQFDKDRYTLADNNWTNNGEGTAIMKKEYLQSIYGTEADGSGLCSTNDTSGTSTATSYIQFEVKNDAIHDILNHDYEGILEKLPTETIATGFHEYRRKDYSWHNNITGVQTHITDPYDEYGEAPYLIFKPKGSRVVSGNVFKDTVDPTSEVCNEKNGDGKVSNEENKVANVKVELLDAGSLEPFHLYGATTTNNPTTPATTSKKEACVFSNEFGNYSFTDVVPGKYYLRFTYADGTQIIYDTSGNEVSKDVNVKNYKSTIVTANSAKVALKDSGQDGLWYKELERSERRKLLYSSR